MGVREAKIEEYLISAVKKLGGICNKWGTYGNPDRVVCLNGNVYFVEVKTKDGKLRPTQELQIERIANTGCFITVVSGYKEVNNFISQIKNLDMLRHTLANANPSKS